MHLVVEPRGTIRGVYTEAIDLTQLGDLAIRRASHVEPDARGGWWSDLAPVGGPRLGPFVRRSDALATELRWLEDRWLGEPGGHPQLATPATAPDMESASLITTALPEDRPWD